MPDISRLSLESLLLTPAYSTISLIRYSSPVTGLECPRAFLEIKVPRFHDNNTGWW
jgi:hypothetical protein